MTEAVVPTPQRAEIIAVGSELLTPFRSDTNSLFITSRLNEIGIAVGAKFIVGDAREELAVFIRASLQRADLLVVTGGLGPTADDVTRLAVADALGRPLEEDPAIVAKIEARFAARGLVMPAINRRQAEVLRGAVVLANPNGTAPGQWVEHDGRVVILLPGPPREMRPMLDQVIAERLVPLVGTARIVRRVLQIAGLPESGVEQVAQPVYSTWSEWTPPVETSILASPGQVELHFSVKADTRAEGEAILDRAQGEMLTVLGGDVYSTDGRRLEEVVGSLLLERDWKVGCAESCTGGLLTSRLTDVPGSSAYLECSVVTYSNEAKTRLLGVSEEVLAEHGAVSEPVAAAMADGMRQRAGVHVAVAVSGIAGPGGGTAQKAVGTVWIGVSSDAGHTVETYQFPGGRDAVKFQASQMALKMLWRRLNIQMGRMS